MSKLVLAIAVLVGIGVAVGVATAPGETLDTLVYRTGVTSFYAAAVPVGVTTRTALALLAGVLAILIVAGPATLMRWHAARPVAKPARPSDTDTAGDDALALLPPPAVRRADAHPDAPPRRPIRAAAEFGTPRPMAWDKPAVPAGPPPEAPLPADLDQPLAAFDPAAIPAEPLAAPEPLPPLARPVPTPIFTVVPEDAHHDAAPAMEVAQETGEECTDEPEESISALLARLERGRLARRRATARPVIAPPSPPPSVETLDDTLARLRQLAAR